VVAATRLGFAADAAAGLAGDGREAGVGSQLAAGGESAAVTDLGED